MQRKVYRIESMMAGKRQVTPSAGGEYRRANDDRTAPRTQPDGRANDHNGSDSVQTLKAELARVHDSIASTMRDLGGLIGDSNGRRVARAADELGAAVDGMETATEKILKSVEIIDDGARALSTSLKDDYKRGLSQDIQDHVVKIYEACNFQDLAGQRIGNVIAALTTIEEQVAAMLARHNGFDAPAQSPALAKRSAERGLLNGPKLDGDPGHASQGDIDKMFG